MLIVAEWKQNMSSCMSREEVIEEYKRLQKAADEKRDQIMADSDMVDEGEMVGFLVEEHFLMAKLLPTITAYEITREELGLGEIKG